MFKKLKLLNSNQYIIATDYANGYVYENNTLQFFNHAEGYVSNDNGSFSYVYQYKDHLGSIRLSYSDGDGNGSISQSEIIKENHYYPYGLKMRGFNTNVSSLGNSVAQKYMFNGKEFDDSFNETLNTYDFGARNYDPALGRWMNVDPLSQFHSPYNYTGNNPVNFIDPDGRYSYNWDTENYETDDGQVVSFETVQENNYKEPFSFDDIIFRDKSGKEIARYVTTDFKYEIEIPYYLSLGFFSSIDLNEKYEGLDLDDLDAIGLSGGFGYYFGAGGGKSWEVVFFMDGKDKGTHEFYTTKSSGLGLEGKTGFLVFGVEFFNFLNGDDNFSSKNIEGTSYTLSGSYFNGEISYTHDSNLPKKSLFRSPRTLFGSGSASLHSVKIGGQTSEGAGFSWTRNITTKGVD